MVRAGWRGTTARPAGIHYVAPSFWAFRGGERRAAALAHVVDELLCILPFEPPLLVRLPCACVRAQRR
jgi:lipid A disaccharide synthetase